MIAAGELLGALAGWRGYAAAAFAGAAVAWIAQGWRYGAEIAELQRQQAEENDAQAQATVAAVEAARTERGGAQPPWRKPVMMQRNKPRLRPLGC